MEYNIKKPDSSNAIERMLEGDYETFSVTKIKSDMCANFVDNYINNLRVVMKISEIPFEEFMFLEGFTPGAVVDWQPRIYLIASENDAEKETSTLIKVVERCPEGPILEGIRAQFLEYKGIRKPYEDTCRVQWQFQNFLKNTKDLGKKVLVVDKGPVFYNREELKNISELFLAPILIDQREKH